MNAATKALVAITLAVAVALPAGCSGEDDALTEDASTLLSQSVTASRAAYADDDIEGALSQLDATRDRLAALEQAGEVETARAADIRVAIDDVQREIETSSTTTTSTPTTVEEETTEAPETEPPSTEPPTTETTATTTTTTVPPETTLPPETTVPPDEE